jgi:hypothetical protein
MAALRGLMGGAAGAAAYQACQGSEGVTGGLAAGLVDAFQRKGAGQLAEARCLRASTTGKGMWHTAAGAKERGGGPRPFSNAALVATDASAVSAGAAAVPCTTPRSGPLIAAPLPTRRTQASRMQRQVDDLQSALIRSLQDRGRPTVIVKDSGRGKGWAPPGAGV